MRINLILSGVRDFDLLALLQHEQYQLGKEIRRALRMYVRGDIHSILLPDVRGAPQMVSTEHRRVSITLNDRLDADVIAWIEGIQAGCKSTAIKSVFRNMLEAPYLVGMDRMREGAGRLHEAKKKRQKTKTQPSEQPPEKASAVHEQEQQNDDEFDLFSDAFVGNR